MSVRKFAWKYKPTQLDETRMDEALRSHLYMVNEIGPTQFLIKGEDSPAKFKVTLGDPQSCSGCTSKRGSIGGKSPDLCVHLFFVMLKVLRLPRNNSLVWQASLIDTEITNVLSQRYQRIEERAARRRMQAAGTGDTAGVAATAAGSSSVAADSTVAAAASKGKGEAGTFRVPKRELDPDDVCPICQDELVDPLSAAGLALRDAAPPDAPPLLNLVFCQWSCGQQLHAKCMRVWAEHQLANAGPSEKKLACPMCRASWGSTDPAQQSSNEQMVRDLKIREHEKIALPAPVTEQKGDDGASTALVPAQRQPRSSATAAGSSSSTSSSSSRAAVKCCSCRKMLLLSEGRFMRCVHCADDYNLCRVCFIRSKGIGGGSVPTALLTNRSNHVHCFVEAKPSAHPAVAASVLNAAGDEEPLSPTRGIAAAAAAAEFPYAYGVDWLPAPVKAPPISSQLALTLQSRELTHSDYELLLGLDENIRNNGRPMMHAYLTRTLAVPALRSGAPCVLCQGTILASQPLRVLPCFHQAHESCLQSQLMYDLQLRCPDDSLPVFPGLAFRQVRSLLPRKKKQAPGPEEQALADAGRAGALQVQASSMMFGLSGTGMSSGSVGNSGIPAGTRSLPSESAEERGAPVGEHPGPASRAAPHSHHFQLTPSALPAGTTHTLREQRAAAPATSGKLRTGTAAFALPSSAGAPSGAHEANRGDSHLFTSPLQLSGSSSFAPFVADSVSASPAASAASSVIAVRRGRPSDDRSVPLSVAAPPDVGSLVIDTSSALHGGGASAAPPASGSRSSAKASRPRGPGHSSMFAPPHAHALSASPTRSPTSHDSLDDLSVGAGVASSPPPLGSQSAAQHGARPRVGRAALSSSPPYSSDRAPPLSQLLVGSSNTAHARSFSATTVRPSAAFAKAHAKPPPRASLDSSAGLVHPSQLSIGSATGSLLSSASGTGGSARVSGAVGASASAANRVRRTGGLAAPSAAALAAAEARAHQSAWSASTSGMELAPGVSGFSRTSALADDALVAPAAVTSSEPRVRASSASLAHARRSAQPATASARSSASLSASPGPVAAPHSHDSMGAFSLSGSPFNALDRGENASGSAAGIAGRSATSGGGKLRRGKTAISGPSI